MAKLRGVGRGARIGDSFSSPKAPTMAAKPRSEVKNAGTPAGDFAEFLRSKLPEKHKKPGDSHSNKARERFIQAMVKHGAEEIGVQAVRKWEQGAASPALKDFGAVAKALGYRDWFALVADIKASK